jgi:hypothetical protein
MVYNFNVNDTFQYHSTGNSCCDFQRLNVIQSKSYSANGDTVIYGINSLLKSTIVNFSAMTVTTSVTTSTLTQKYFDLNLQFVAPTLTINNGYYQKDTTIFENCNKQTIKSQAFCFSNFECNTSIDKSSSGLGHTYSYYDNYQSSLVTQGYLAQVNELVYYHKVGELPCGHYVSMVTGIKENNSNTNNFNFYPNPTSNQIAIYSDVIVENIEIADIYGKIFNFGVTNNTVNLNVLNNGVYFFKKINNNIIAAKKIIKVD